MRTADRESVQVRRFAFDPRKFRLGTRPLMLLVGLIALVLGSDIALTKHLNDGISKRFGRFSYQYLEVRHESAARFCRSAIEKGIPYVHSRSDNDEDDPDVGGMVPGRVIRFQSWKQEAAHHDHLTRIYRERTILYSNRTRWRLWPF